MAGISAPLCTACGIEPLAVAALRSERHHRFRIRAKARFYTLGYSCTGIPAPSGLPDSARCHGAACRICFSIGSTPCDAAFPDENSQLFRNGANGMPGVESRQRSSVQLWPADLCFNVNNSDAGGGVGGRNTDCCVSATVPSPVSSDLCGLDVRFEPSPSSSFSTVCSGISRA